MLWIAVLAVWAVMRLLQFLWNRNGRNWKGWEGDHEVPLTLWEYMEWGQMKKDLEDYVYFSWHYLCKVMKECWSIIILVQCWEMYWRLPMTGCEDVERQLVKILFLKVGSLAQQMYFQQCRTAKKVESIEVEILKGPVRTGPDMLQVWLKAISLMLETRSSWSED